MGRYENPILAGCHPDPSICRVGDTYYLVTSTFEYLPGLPIHASKNLVDWELIGHAIHRPEQLDLRGLESSRGLYAPTIRAIGDLLVVVCTAVGPDDGSWTGRTGHFLVTASDAAGPWSDPVWIDDVGGFDPSITVDGDRVWLCGTRPPEPMRWPGETEVWLAELELATGRLLTEPIVVWRGADSHAVWAEGPHIVARPGGGWMLVAAEGGTDTDHAVVVAYADEITGPYVGDTGNPRLTHRDLGATAPINSVGHADVVDTPDGRAFATVLALHAVDGRRGLLGRRTSLVPVDWEDGRPLFAPGVARVPPVVETDGVPDAVTASRVFIDDFESKTLRPEWTSVGRFPSTFVDLAARAGHARLDGGAHSTSIERVSALLTRLPSERTAIEAVIDLVPGGDEFRAGLLLRVSERNHLEFTVGRDGGVEASLLAHGDRHPAGVGTVSIDGPVRLGIDITDLVASCHVSGTVIATADVSALAPGPPTGFVGAWVGVVAVGDGYCDVDRVDLRW
ncbi:glycoside hydrolase family 43 protein [Herbiconiux sp. L3-i23]|uniref:glycoside hydrolase family 43 protein n=1 Tax=Herbiconiux sp. L3-i23 TaxID=2905871 RepID=UPI00206C5F55|nr:glycoside hydrolase family 43 protein [Herbiconiux sp. L3-i23]BDI22973.1 hypothetical protein L3i23_17490 [Herbiconiux sp. L3-i23]